MRCRRQAKVVAERERCCDREPLHRGAAPQNPSDRVLFALPELTVSNENLKLSLIDHLKDDLKTHIKSETNQ